MIKENFFRVEVPLPPGLLDVYGRETSFVFQITHATRGSNASGRSWSDRHGPYEWAEFADLAQAERCETELDATVKKFLLLLEARNGKDPLMQKNDRG